MSEPMLRFRTFHRYLAGVLHRRSGRVRDMSPIGRLRPIGLLLALPLLASCARQTAQAVSDAPDTPGFLLGLWHGFIFPVAWIISLFVDRVAIYAVPNNGGWYDFGYFLGIVVFGVGANKTRTVTRIVTVRIANPPRTDCGWGEKP
jgi:hypothetical protein